MSHWSNAYIGIPHDPDGASHAGANCWTLACLVYAEQLGISLPSFREDYVSLEEHREIDAIVSRAASFRPWSRVDAAEQYDIAVFRRGRWMSHVGIVIRPGLMLHVSNQEQSRIERYDGVVWSHRLMFFLRHERLSNPSQRGLE